MIDERELGEPDPSPTDDETSASADGESSWTGLVVTLVLLGMLGAWSLPLLGVVLAIVFFVFMHELGHFVTARLTGMKVTEFFIGFGPRIFSFKRGETEFGLKPILAGAYVRIIGMNNIDEVDPADEARTYRRATYPRRVLVITAGSLMHFAMAVVLLFVYFGFIGEPTSIVNWSIDAPSPDSGAEAAGLEAGDIILSIDGAEIVTFTDLRTTVEVRGGQTVPIVIDRDGVVETLVTTIGERTLEGEETTGFLGVGIADGFTLVRTTDSVPAAAQRAVTELPTQIGRSLSGMVQIASNVGGIVDNVFTAPGNQDQIDLETRPVSIVGVADISSRIGLDAILFLATFNIFIGVFNLLPLLPLDGGHLAVATYERIRSIGGKRHQVDVMKLLPLTYAVFMILVLFGLGALWLDLANPIQL
ncbi:MAG: site-2 protease family protein [Actinobacteria bacterium]|nr:site-2 protease family protein [Actinomycetota bacterium]